MFFSYLGFWAIIALSTVTQANHEGVSHNTIDKYLTENNNKCYPRNIEFIIDQSGSVNPTCESKFSATECSGSYFCGGVPLDQCFLNYFEIEKQFVVSVIEKLQISEDTIHVGLIRFSSADRVREDLEVNCDEGYCHNFQKVEEIIDAMPYERGYTFTEGALKIAHEALERKKADGETRNGKAVEKTIVLISDGKSNDGTAKLGPSNLDIAKKIKGENTKIIAIAIGDVNGEFLPELVGITGNVNQVESVESFENLFDVVDRVAYQLCASTKETEKVPLSNDINKVTYNDVTHKTEIHTTKEGDSSGSQSYNNDDDASTKVQSSSENDIIVDGSDEIPVASSSSVSLPIIIGAAVGGAVVLIVIIILVICCVRREKRKKELLTQLSEAEKANNVRMKEGDNNPIFKDEMTTGENRIYAEPC